MSERSTMQDVIAINKATLNGVEESSVNSREIYKYLEVGYEYAEWIKRSIDKYTFIEGEDFSKVKVVVKPGEEIPYNNTMASIGGTSKISKPQNKRFAKSYTTMYDYIVTVDMAKELCMISNTEKGQEIRRYFVAAEKEAKVLALKLQQARTQLFQMKLEKKDKLIAQLSAAKSREYRKLTSNNRVYVCAEAIAENQEFTAKGFRKFMKELGLVKHVPKVTKYWECSQEGLEGELVIKGETGTPYYDKEYCTNMYIQELTGDYEEDEEE